VTIVVVVSIALLGIGPFRAPQGVGRLLAERNGTPHDSRDAGGPGVLGERNTLRGPSIALTPKRASPGQEVQVHGTRFPAHASVQITWDGSAEGMPGATTRRNGSFDTTITVPSGAKGGSHTIEASVDGKADSAILRVRANGGDATPTPIADATATRTPVPSAQATATPTRSPTATATAGAGGGPDAVRAGALKLTATFNSVGVELLFGDDANANAAAALEFRKAGDSAFRQGLPLWRTGSPAAPGPAFYGSALLLQAGTSYEVRVTLTDPDGVSGPAVVTGTVRTRADNIPSAAGLAPTHFVRADGNDANGGGGDSPSGAWRTLTKAFASAPPGAVVRLGPGYFARPSGGRASPITLVAQHPAVADGGSVINAGRHSVVDSGVVSSPTGSGGPNAGAWQRVTLTGPGLAGAPGGAKYAVWMWAGSGVSPTQLGYASSREAAPRRVANWKAGGADLATPAGWAEKLYTNRSYNYGFYASGQDVYLRLPGDRDPNTLYITVGGGAGLGFGAANVRVSGLEIRTFESGVRLDQNSSSAVIDHNLFTGNQAGLWVAGAKGPPPQYGGEHVVEHNRFEDANLWAFPQPADGSLIPWSFIKGSITSANGSGYGANRLGEKSESEAIYLSGGAKRMVVRFNTIQGPFNGITGYNVGFDRYASQDTDVHDNLVRQIADDCFEPETYAINWRIWNNRCEDTFTVLSTCPVAFGPVYVFRNVGWRTGSRGVGLLRGESGANFVAVGFKYSAGANPPSRVWVVNNTFWSDDVQASGGDQYAGGSGGGERFWVRNNIFRMGRYAFAAPPAPRWDEDHDHFYTTDPSRGINYNSANQGTIAAYRAASGQGQHSNRAGDVRAHDPALVDPAAGNLDLPGGSPLVDAGVPVPNIADGFTGAAPDLGAAET
jgi:hypothetical protein